MSDRVFSASVMCGLAAGGGGQPPARSSPNKAGETGPAAFSIARRAPVPKGLTPLGDVLLVVSVKARDSARLRRALAKDDRQAAAVGAAVFEAAKPRPKSWEAPFEALGRAHQAGTSGPASTEAPVPDAAAPVRRFIAETLGRGGRGGPPRSAAAVKAARAAEAVAAVLPDPGVLVKKLSAPAKS